MAKRYEDKVSSATALATKPDDVGPMTLEQAATSQLAGFIQQADAQQLADEIASGAIEAAPILFEFKEGMRVTCEVLDQGETTIEDINTRQPKRVNTWTLQLLDPAGGYRKGPKVSVLGTAQLDRQLPPFLGCIVTICRGGTVRTRKGVNLTEYLVGLDLRAPRNAAARRMIDAPATEAGNQ